MSKYKYNWDSENKKKTYGGKYEEINRGGLGHYGRNTAGNRQEFNTKDYGTPRHFIGSDMQEYTFFNTKQGMHTITAESYEEAVRIAQSLGYSASDYKKR